jgi:hypothetical protein
MTGGNWGRFPISPFQPLELFGALLLIANECGMRLEEPPFSRPGRQAGIEGGQAG